MLWPAHIPFTLQMIDITVVSCSEIITYGGKWAVSKEIRSETIRV